MGVRRLAFTFVPKTYHKGPLLAEKGAMMEHMGFISLGRMGQRMAGRLLDAGLHLTVYDIDAKKASDLEQLAGMDQPR